MCQNISWASATQYLHPPQVQTLELQFFTLDLNTLKISSLVPNLRKIPITAVPHVIKKGWYHFQNMHTLEGSDYRGSRNRRQRKYLITISREKEDNNCWNTLWTGKFVSFLSFIYQIGHKIGTNKDSVQNCIFVSYQLKPSCFDFEQILVLLSLFLVFAWNIV